MVLGFEPDLEDLQIDPSLLACVPASLADYYLALPLAREEHQVSLLTAHPDNQTGLAKLETLLGAKVLPLYASEQHLRRAIRRSYPNAWPAPAISSYTAQIVAWRGPDPIQDKTQDKAQDTAHRLGRLLHLPVRLLAPPDFSKGAGSTAMRQFRAHTLLVVTGLLLEQTPTLLAQAPAPLWLVRGPWRPLRRLLVVLRGFASDARVLDWAIPLARQSHAAVTLLVLSQLPCPDLQTIFCREGPRKAHLDGCLQRLEEGTTPARLVMRQGQPLDQLLNELAQPDGYDLLALAAEGQGAFVTQVLTALQQRRLHDQRPVLIVKPPA